VTTQSGGNYTAAPNLLSRRFAPGQVPAWVADLTFVRTEQGMLYLSVVMNLSSRRVLGWSMGNSQTGQMALEALKMALSRARPEEGQYHHSDRGGQYVSKVYRMLAARHGMRISMSRQGNCWDNAVAESFFATLKRELLHGEWVKTREQARRMIFEYIELFYNRQRKHSALGYLSPVEYEKLVGAP